MNKKLKKRTFEISQLKFYKYLLCWLNFLFLMNVIDLQDEPPPSDSGANQSQDSVLKKVRAPLAGDLLGRERVTGAKKTRLGCDSIVERF